MVGHLEKVIDGEGKVWLQNKSSAGGEVNAISEPNSTAVSLSSTNAETCSFAPRIVGGIPSAVQTIWFGCSSAQGDLVSALLDHAGLIVDICASSTDVVGDTLRTATSSKKACPA